MYEKKEMCEILRARREYVHKSETHNQNIRLGSYTGQYLAAMYN